MISSRAKIIKSASFLADIVLTVMAFFLAYIIRTSSLYQPFVQWPIRDLSYHYWLIFAAVPAWTIIFLLSGRYRRPAEKTLREQITLLAADILLGGAIITTLIFMSKTLRFSRSLVLLFLLVDFAFLSIKVLAARYFGKSFNKWIDPKRILIVGTAQKAMEFLNVIRQQDRYGLECVGVLCIDSPEKCMGPNPVPVIGDTSRMTEILDTKQVDSVVFSVPADRVADMADAIKKCEETGTKIYLDIEVAGLSFSKGFAESVGGKPLLTFTSTPHSPAAVAAKRVLDFVVSLVLLIVLSPVLLLTAFLVKLTSKGPVFFVQKRSGLYGKELGVIKFRTMERDAEEKKEDVRVLNEMNGPVFKIQNDPRLTKLGKVLRKLSIDEFPQIINVLGGRMSLVGPRPLPVDEIKKLPERWQRRRLSMKPGITCLWQVNGRNTIDFDKWMKLDLEYIDNWSLALDFKILLSTIPAVILTRGAS